MIKTRIEAAVVVSVLVILAALLWQSLPKARHLSPHIATCVSNLKMLGIASCLYEGDNQMAFPGPQPFGAGLAQISWDRPLAIQLGAGIKVDEPLASLTNTHATARTLATFTCPQDALKSGACAFPIISGSVTAGTAPGTGICRSYTLNLGSGNLVAGVVDGVSATANAISVGKIETDAGTAYLIESHRYATVFGQCNIANDTTMICSKAGAVIPGDAFASLPHVNMPSPMLEINDPWSTSWTQRRLLTIPRFWVKPKPYFNVLMHDGHVEMMKEADITDNHGQVMQYVK